MPFQVYYDYSSACKAVAGQWEQAGRELGPWLRLGRIEWNQQYLLESLWRLTGLKIQGEELPAVFGFPRSCLQQAKALHELSCYVR